MKVQKKGALAASALAAMAAGGVFGATVLTPAISGAATSSTTVPAASTAPSGGAPAGPSAFDPAKGGHMANGITETLLTGDTAAKVKAAALAAVPGGTIQRVENDAEGSPYEAHMSKADGSRVTVKVDASFKVTTIETGR